MFAFKPNFHPTSANMLIDGAFQGKSANILRFGSHAFFFVAFSWQASFWLLFSWLTSSLLLSSFSSSFEGPFAARSAKIQSGFKRHFLWIHPLPKGRIGLSIGDVRAEPTVKNFTSAFSVTGDLSS